MSTDFEVGNNKLISLFQAAPCFGGLTIALIEI